MREKTVVITGGTSGIGEVAAVTLAKMGARIVLVARENSRAAMTLTRLRDSAPGIAHAVYFAGILRLAEMKRVAAQIANQEPRVDVLINNAGALFGTRQLTEDGLERTFALNHMAYFIITAGLRERLSASAPSRIVNTASAAHQRAKLDFDDLQSAKSFGAVKAYGWSKLRNILFTRELACRLHGTGVTANCPHPGFVATRFGDQSGACSRPSFGLRSFSRYPLLRAQRRSSISRPRQTWPRRRDNTSISPRPSRRRRGPKTIKPPYCSGSAARRWPA